MRFIGSETVARATGHLGGRPSALTNWTGCRPRRFRRRVGEGFAEAATPAWTDAHRVATDPRRCCRATTPNKP